MKICHVTSVHHPEDIRIFHKECVSLAQAGHEVYLVQKGPEYEKNGVHIAGFGEAPKGKLGRMLFGARKAYLTAKKLDCDVYHLHDPELLPYGRKLKRLGYQVIFDSHEDAPAQIRDKKWIPKCLRGLASRLYRAVETFSVRRFDAVVAATPYIARQFRGRSRRVVTINNYPRLDDIRFQTSSFEGRGPVVCYAGGINEDRGEKLMAKAMERVDGELIIAGDHEKMTVGKNIRYVGRLDRDGVNDLYGRSVAGLCILKPIKNYYYSQPIKMYEYMAAGLPFVCSDFPGWRKVAEESGAGICVDPQDTEAMAAAIQSLIDDRDRAQQMGWKGREYVIANCTWKKEEKKLIRLYQKLSEDK